MKIVLLNRSNSLEFPGGDTVQINAIAEYLADMSYDVQVINDFDPKLSDNDLAIIFNLTNPYEALIHSKLATANGVPFILFPVYWDLERTIPINAYPNILAEIIKRIVPVCFRDLIKGARYYLKNYDRIKKLGISYKFREFLFRHALINKIIDNAACVCPNSEAEKVHLLAAYSSMSRARTHIIKNGFDNKGDISNEIMMLEKQFGSWVNHTFICCVGGIGPRKNQLNLIKASNAIDVTLVIVGKPSLGSEKYYNLIRSISSSKVVFTGSLDHRIVQALLSKATVHVQPSFIETPGIASLEAAAQGCQIVVSDVPPVREYFQENAYYCNPHSVDSIANSIKNALAQGRPNPTIQKYVKENYQWDIVLEPLLNVINSI
ncbi:MAG: glycosyltransferase family 4 protein [Syntrophomonadaceae bacterium]|nr:glycosyltransferase family 4 protein [Syntrophomonadaceae bacterium]